MKNGNKKKKKQKEEMACNFDQLGHIYYDCGLFSACLSTLYMHSTVALLCSSQISC